MKHISELSKEKIIQLNELYKYSPVRRIRIRAHCILLSYYEFSIKLISIVLRHNRVSISTWIDNFKQDGISGLSDAPRSGRPPKLTEKEEQMVLDQVAETPRSLNKVVLWIKEHLNKEISKDTLIRILKKNKRVWKRMRRSLKRKRDELAFQTIKEFIKHLLTLERANEIDLFFFDESIFNLLPNIPSAWQEVGKTIELDSQRSKNLNILGFMNTSNELHPYQVDGSVTSDVVIGCFKDFIEGRKKQDVPLFIIIDNASTHTSNEFKRQQEEWQKENCVVFNLPAYSPELNIIEILWRFIKYKWIELDAYKSFENLKSNIVSTLRLVGDKYQINFQNEKKCQEIYT